MKSTPFSEAAILKLLPYLVVLLLIASYLNTLNSPAILDDEHSFISTSKIQIQDFSLGSFAALKNSEFGLGRLLPIITLAVDNYFSHGQAAGYHITNIVIHIAAFFSLAFFLRQLMRLPVAAQALKICSPQYLVWAVAGLWALNPVQTNAVTYIVQRMASLCALFYILSLALYLQARQESDRRNKWICFFGATLTAGCSFFSKENSATLPFAILLLEDFFISPGIIKKYIGRFIKCYWLPILVVLALLFPILTQKWHGIAGSYGSRPFNLTERLLTESRVVIWYISLLLLPLPSRMNIDHDWVISHSIFSPMATVFSIIVLVLLLIFAIKIRRNLPLLSFGILFFFLNILIESSIIPLELVFEHRLYLPSLGIFLSILTIADLAIFHFLKERNESLQKATILGLIILFAGSSLLTTLRNYDWRDEISIYGDMAKKSPHKPRALGNYGMALSRAGQPTEGLKYLDLAFSEGKPNAEGYYGITNNLLLTYNQLYGPKEALNKTSTLMHRIPKDADLNNIDRLHHNLANIYFQDNQLENAYDYVKQALFLMPSDQNQVTIGLCMDILFQVYDDTTLRSKFGLSDGSKPEAVGEKVISLLIDSRDYNKASLMIDEFSRINREKSDKLRGLLEVQQTLNHKAQMASDINNDQNYIDFLDFRWSVKAANFINGYYQPLKPLAKFLTERSRQQFPNDPFAGLAYFRELQSSNPIAAKELLINELLTEFPDFPPLLMTVLEYRNTLPAITLRTGKRLLEIYPKAPDWKQIQLMILTYQAKMAKGKAT